MLGAVPCSTPCGGLPQNDKDKDITMDTDTEINALIRTRNTTPEDLERASLVVTKRGVIIKNRNGKCTRPDNDLVCTLTAMVVTSEVVELRFPEHECCSMTAAVHLAACASPSATQVQTWSGEKQDTIYVKAGEEWKAVRPH